MLRQHLLSVTVWNIQSDNLSLFSLRRLSRKAWSALLGQMICQNYIEWKKMLFVLSISNRLKDYCPWKEHVCCPWVMQRWLEQKRPQQSSLDNRGRIMQKLIKMNKEQEACIGQTMSSLDSTYTVYTGMGHICPCSTFFWCCSTVNIMSHTFYSIMLIVHF